MRQTRVAAYVVGAVVVSLLVAAGCAPIRAGRAMESAADFQSNVLAPGQASAVAFYTDSCPWCLAYGPTWERLEAEYAGRVRFFRVNSDTSPEIAARYLIYAAPTTLLFRDGKEVERLIGAKPVWTVRGKLDAMLAKP